MGWDDSDAEDDDWENEDVDAKLEALQKEKEKEKRRAEGLDSESEEEEAAKPAPKAEPSSKGPGPEADKPKQPKKGKGKAPEPEPAEVEQPVLDPKAEKARRQKLVEEADARLADDLFAGCDKSEIAKEKEKEEAAKKAKAAEAKKATKPQIKVVDAFDAVQLKVQADVENLCNTCCTKIESGQAKGAAMRFLADSVKQLEDKLETKELSELEKLINDIVRQKKAHKGAVQQKDNKANTKLSKTTKFNASSEWEEVYGGGDGDEDWTQEEWDEWYKTQGK